MNKHREYYKFQTYVCPEIAFIFSQTGTASLVIGLSGSLPDTWQPYVQIKAAFHW
jgi:hypothetical protein